MTVIRMCQPNKFLSSEDAMGDDGLYHSKKTPTRIVCAMGMLVSSCVECSQWDFILQGHSIILTLHMVLSSVRRSQIARVIYPPLDMNHPFA